MSIYSNSSRNSYAHLDDPFQMLEFSNSNCCRMAPYVKCTHCFSKCDKCCKGILQGARGSFSYNLAGSSCGCGNIPDAVESCQSQQQDAQQCPREQDAVVKSCGRSGGLKCKYY